MDRTTETEALKSPDELCFRMRKSLGRGFPPHPALVEFPSQKMGIRRGLDVSWCLATSRAIFPFFPLDGILIYAYHPSPPTFASFLTFRSPHVVVFPLLMEAFERKNLPVRSHSPVPLRSDGFSVSLAFFSGRFASRLDSVPEE